MTCAHGYAPEEGHEGLFAIDASQITFGRGAIDELGAIAREAGIRRIALFTDPRVASLGITDRARRSLAREGVDVGVYDRVRIEPTDASFLDAAAFAKSGRFDGYASLGGGSVIDTCKAAILYATYPAEFLAYVNPPVGGGVPVPGVLPPHIACPTTSGTGSELTGIAVCDVSSIGAKTGIASRRLRPTWALVDPDATDTLPSSVVAASGFDVLCHALESFTAKPFTARPRPKAPGARPMSQGRNPWSDVGSREALRLGGAFLVRAVRDREDREAREAMMWAATLAGVAFGNAGVHVPHAMAYAVAGMARDFRMPDYPDEDGLIPHGVSVIVNAPETFRWTASASPERHLEAAALLGARTVGVGSDDAGALLAETITDRMREANIPLDLSALGYGDGDVLTLVEGTIVQRRLLDNAPRPVDEAALTRLFQAAMTTGGDR